MMSTLWHAYINPEGKPTPMRPLAEKYQEYMWENNFPTNGRRAYREHNNLVRGLGEAKGADFLQYNVNDGWEPLCKLPQKQVPVKAFPRQDDWLGYKAKYAQLENNLGESTT